MTKEEIIDHLRYNSLVPELDQWEKYGWMRFKPNIALPIDVTGFILYRENVNDVEIDHTPYTLAVRTSNYWIEVGKTLKAMEIKKVLEIKP